MNLDRLTVQPRARSFLRRSALLAAVLVPLLLVAAAQGQGTTKTETFDRDPGWDGHNHRSTKPPVTVRQDFGYSRTRHAGGQVGEIGGFISPASEAAYYGKVIPPATFKDKLSASGTIACSDGNFHVLLGFFNSETLNEWRTPNTIVLRLNGRGDRFLAYPEYLTAKWRISEGKERKFFPSVEVPKPGVPDSEGFASGGKVHKWTLMWDPTGHDGKPILRSTIDGETAVSYPDPAYVADGATFNRIGLLNVMKSAEPGAEIYIDDLIINGETETFDADPKWEGHNNRGTSQTQKVRPRFDFGFSPTHFAGGKTPGEMGGLVFSGDNRYPELTAYYADRVGPLTLDKPFKASGKIALRRGVSDSSSVFGFFNSKTSIQDDREDTSKPPGATDDQDGSTPKNFIGIAIEGVGREGLFFQPNYRMMLKNYRTWGDTLLRIYPDGTAHDWSLEYDPSAAAGRGKITVMLDGRSVSLDLKEGHRASGATFDHFGLITSWIDGNQQEVFFDDLTYTVAQPADTR